MSVDQWVAEGLKALQANQSFHIPGRLNRVMRKFMHTSPARRFMTKMQRESAMRLQQLSSAFATTLKDSVPIPGRSS